VLRLKMFSGTCIQTDDCGPLAVNINGLRLANGSAVDRAFGPLINIVITTTIIQFKTC
jgi:hypothetical protein